MNNYNTEAIAVDCVDNDNRLFPRESVVYDISFEVRDIMNGLEHNDGFVPLTGQVTNISNGGVCLRSRHDLKKSQVVKLGLPIAETGIQVNVLAEVRWTYPVEINRNDNMAGLKFFL